MYKIGLTGGLCTGKTFVAECARQSGIPVLDADQIARDVCEPGQEGHALIGQEFGAQLFDEHQNLKRRELARLVFEDPSSLSKLEAIVHPLVRREVLRQIELLMQLDVPQLQPACVLDIPLLYEVGWDELVNSVIVVHCRKEQQLERALKRGFSHKDIERRIAAQWPLGTKIQRADYVIDNSGSEEQTRRQFDQVWQQIAPTK